MNTERLRDTLIASRVSQIFPSIPIRKHTPEGGCGVIGVSSSIPIAGKHLLQGLNQMKNRGNSKGGGIAAVGLDPEFFNTTSDILNESYLIAGAYLDTSFRSELESNFIEKPFIVEHVFEIPTLSDISSLNLTVTPPKVICYFVRVKPEVRKKFMAKHHLNDSHTIEADDEIVYQNTYRLNSRFYQSEGEKQALVFSHAKNMLVCKSVGFGDDVIRYYQLEDLYAHIWIGHHRYPTRGKVIHPGGAHPFIGMNEALVHNGDFANYSSLCTYLSQSNVYPLFLTDTEVAALTFDLYHRVAKYPLEYVIETFAPTTERDFTLLDYDKQGIYKDLETTHIHGSPDGPWFFLLAQSDHRENVYRLIGITDTSMLRPQVFAIQNGKETIGFSSSEKQVIDATLESIASESSHVWSSADLYWSARGGSHTDGGAFIFTVTPQENKKASMVCDNKFGKHIDVEPPKHLLDTSQTRKMDSDIVFDPRYKTEEKFNLVSRNLAFWSVNDIESFLKSIERNILDDTDLDRALPLLTLLLDHRYKVGNIKRSYLLSLIDDTFTNLINKIDTLSFQKYLKITSSNPLPELKGLDTTLITSGVSNKVLRSKVLIIDSHDFPSEGADSLSQTIVNLYKRGFVRFVLFNVRGQRFIGNGLGAVTKNVDIDVYGSPGDYLASGIGIDKNAPDNIRGVTIRVHNNGQDQVGNIMKDGTLVIYGDVGQTYMYGAKGGEAYVLGNAAGRPYIGAVGHPRGIINGTCLDYLAESFMAGDPLNGGGFVIVLGVYFDNNGKLQEMDTPYPGSNLFSLAPGGAIYIRDPHNVLSENQLNGGKFTNLTPDDWNLIKPYLKKNEQFFGITIERLLTVNGELKSFENIFRKIVPAELKALTPEEAWVKKHS
ncbi:hypothetical protein MYX06_02910 [Patescibacteria group bacterium AH-259-L05]|nr:hypothetical protein [Patescibacteria group bacterium AH-259-L05]